jgi:hypothetical protein
MKKLKFNRYKKGRKLPSNYPVKPQLNKTAILKSQSKKNILSKTIHWNQAKNS